MPKMPKAVSGRQRGGANGARRSKTGTRAGADAEKTAKGDGKATATDGKAVATEGKAPAKAATKRAPKRRTAKAAPAKAAPAKPRRSKASNDKPAAVDFSRRPVDAAPAAKAAKAPAAQLSESEQGLLADLSAVIEEHDEKGHVDREAVERAFVFACERHADQRRRSGENFIVHPI